MLNFVSLQEPEQRKRGRPKKIRKVGRPSKYKPKPRIRVVDVSKPVGKRGRPPKPKAPHLVEDDFPLQNQVSNFDVSHEYKFGKYFDLNTSRKKKLSFDFGKSHCRLHFLVLTRIKVIKSMFLIAGNGE